jgi:hypothetical protein
MLPFRSDGCDQGGRPGFDPAGVGGGHKPARMVRLNRFSLCALVWFVSIVFLLNLFPGGNAFADKKKAGGGRKKRGKVTSSPGEQSLANIPLPVGQEAKGLVLPDFDLQGHLRGRFEAGRARRIDEEHVGFHKLKITTYTPDNQLDLVIEMNDSVLNLKTRILTSKERTTIRRADFNITGDTVQFDANTHTGKLVGNVKMVITDQSHLRPQTNE